MSEALKPRTLVAYSKNVKMWEDHCNGLGIRPYPVQYHIFSDWVKRLADGYSWSSIGVIVSSVIHAHRHLGGTFDRRHPAFRSAWLSVREKKKDDPANSRPKLTDDDIRDLLRFLRANIAADARDGALISLMWVTGMRRSEVVALDWQLPGDGRGWMYVVGDGVIIETTRVRTNLKEALGVFNEDRCQFWLEQWAEAANLAPGTPVFREVNRHGRIGSRRLHDGSVNRILQSRLKELYIVRNMSDTMNREKTAELRKAAKKWSRRFTSDSLRG